ncbi:transcription cofactor vestigial-like protein 4 [Arapaima gigas]
MAVANVHYITRMSSGFKVYILEGQPSLRTEDRHRHVASERSHLPPVYAVKRKHSPECGAPAPHRLAKVQRLPPALTLRERAPIRRMSCSLQRESSLSPPQRSPTSPQYAVVTTTTRSPSQSPSHRLSSPAHSPTCQWPSPVFDGPPMEEPLALIKKPKRAEAPQVDSKDRSKPGSQVQMRPSVITCVSRSRPATEASEPQCRSTVSGTLSPAYDQVVEEHFRRSLGGTYLKGDPPCQTSVSISVDDHFAKALGEKWLQLRASSSSSYSSPSSSPRSSPSFSPVTEGVFTPSSTTPSSPVK